MEAIFTQLLTQLNSSIFTLVALLHIAAWGIWKAGNLNSDYKHLIKNDNRMEKDIRIIKDKLGKLEAKMDLLYSAFIQGVRPVQKGK